MPVNSYKRTRILMGMPITVMIIGGREPKRAFDAVYALLSAVDTRFSTYKPDSEVSRVNNGLPEAEWSDELRDVLARCARTKQETDGYFDAWPAGARLDPSGLVKGWAVKRAAELLLADGYDNFYIDAGGDIQTHGQNAAGEPWRVGIRSPFKREEIVKVLSLARGEGVATSGAYIRGDHIYNPHRPDMTLRDVASLTVIGPDVYEADRFATAAYAMGLGGIRFIDKLQGFAGYLVDARGQATMTRQFGRYAV